MKSFLNFIPDSFRKIAPLGEKNREALRWGIRCGLILILAALLQIQPAFSQQSPRETPLESNGNQSPNGSPASASASPNAVTEPVSTSQPDPTEALVPDFFLASVALDAEVVDDRVKVEADVEVVINKGVGWHSIPLQFNQAHIWSREYDGPGEESPDFSPNRRDDGIYWMLKGLGKHRLKFSMWVPVKREGVRSQFVLSLPPLSTNFDTQLKLTIPEANAAIAASQNLEILSTKHSKTSTEVSASVSRNHLDCTWTVPQGTGATVSKVLTNFHLKPSTDSLVLDVKQFIDLQPQATRELLIRVPTDFEILNLTGRNIRPYSKVEDRDGWVRIPLMADASARIELHWLLRKQISKEGDKLTIDGLEVEGAVQEGGTVRIDELPGYRILPQNDASRLVFRVNIEEMSFTEMESPNSVYEFLQQPFRLVQEIQPVEPLHSVTPIYEVRLNQKKTMRLIVHQLVEVERGSVSSLTMRWPDSSTDGWKLKGNSTDAETLAEIPTTFNELTDGITLQLASPLLAGEHVHLITEFERPVSIQDRSDLSWTLPQIPQQYVRGKLIVTELADEFNLAFDEALVEKLPLIESKHYINQIADIWKVSDPFRNKLLSKNTRIVKTADAERLHAVVTQHQQKVTAKTTVEVQEATPRDLLIKQKFDLEVEHGRLKSIDFNIPASLLKYIQPTNVSSSLDVRLAGKSLDDIVLVGPVLKVSFPEAIFAQNTLEIRYRFPFDDDTDLQNVKLPVVSLSQVPLTGIECLIIPIENVQVTQNASGWAPVQTSPQGALWVKQSGGKTTFEIPLLVGGTLVDSSQQYVVDVANLWTRFEEDGKCETFARYEILSPKSRLLMTFPSGSEFKSIQVDGVPLTEYENDRGKIVITLPEGTQERRILELQYRNDRHSAFSLANPQVFDFPEFSESVWVNETVWEFNLPFGHHLFEYPALKPLFSWRRNGIVWERQANPSYQLERKELLSSIPEMFQFQNNYYAFRVYSPIRKGAFRSMNRSLILLIGAGFALGLGFLFYHFPATRNVFSFFVLAFAFAVASLWYLEPMLLLLQPAGFGVLLALTATVIDVRMRRLHADPSERHSRRSRQRDRFDENPASDQSIGGNAMDAIDGTTRIYTPTGSSISKISNE